MSNILIRKIARQWIITVDGTDYSADELSNIIDLHARSITSGLRRRNEQEQIEWLSDLLWRKENNIPINVSVYRKGDEWFTIKQVVDKTKCSKSVAYKRIQEWINGVRTTEQLLEPALSHSEAIKRAMANRKHEYSKRDKRNREERMRRLNKIPGPTELERKLWGY